jgi:hypothetical protein
MRGLIDELTMLKTRPAGYPQLIAFHLNGFPGRAAERWRQAAWESCDRMSPPFVVAFLGLVFVDASANRVMRQAARFT